MVGPSAPRTGTERADSARRWNLAALVLALATAVGVSFLPLATTSTDTAVVEGSGTTSVESTSSSTSLFAAQGWWVLVVALIPALVAAAPLVVGPPPTRWWVRLVATVVLGAVVVVGAASIGLLFAPVLALMIVALVLTPRCGPRGSGRHEWPRRTHNAPWSWPCPPAR